MLMFGLWFARLFMKLSCGDEPPDFGMSLLLLVWEVSDCCLVYSFFANLAAARLLSLTCYAAPLCWDAANANAFLPVFIF